METRTIFIYFFTLCSFESCQETCVRFQTEPGVRVGARLGSADRPFNHRWCEPRSTRRLGHGAAVDIKRAEVSEDAACDVTGRIIRSKTVERKMSAVSFSSFRRFGIWEKLEAPLVEQRWKVVEVTAPRRPGERERLTSRAKQSLF